MKDWWTPAELLDEHLVGLPGSKSGLADLIRREEWSLRVNVNGDLLARKRKGRGGGMEYHRSVLPALAQFDLAKRAAVAPVRQENPAPGETANRVDWDWYESLPDERKQKALERRQALDQVHALHRAGIPKNLAVFQVAHAIGVGKSAVYNWLREVKGLDRADWLPTLAPKHTGRTATAECDPAAWAFIKADYLRLSQPSFETCFERLKTAAAEKGWKHPGSRTLQRRLTTEVPKPVITLMREGYDALQRMYPPQERDRSGFHALEALNADGHKWDVFVQWPDGEIGRPMMVAIQDLYSNKILGWRVDRSENSDSVRLAFADVFRDYGIPDKVWLDNGRGFASKWITGGQPNRYRFKVKPEEPQGVLTALGIEVHWTRPYSGQSKPIERAFRDLCDSVAKHPAFDGAYTGNKPDAKPENYGTRAVPIDEFLAVVEQGIRLHNARPNRNTRVCRRQLSFDQAFEQSYQQSAIRKAGPAQLRMCLMAAEKVRAHRENGALKLFENRYWSEALIPHAGEALTVRFDPDDLHAGVHVYRLDGSFIAEAGCLEAAGFADTGAGRDHNRKRAAFKRATREAAKLEQQLSVDDLVRLLPDIEEPDPTAPRVLRMVNGPATVAPQPEKPDSDFNFDEAFSKGLIAEQRRAQFRLVDE